MTKHMFRTALIELMEEKPFHKITIKEICERADLNRTTFYLHYTDQTQLLNEIIERIEEDMAKCIATPGDESDGQHRLEKYLEYVKANARIYKTLMKSDDDVGARTKIIRDILRDIKDALPVLGKPLENRYIYRFIIDGSISMILNWIDSGFDISTEVLAKLIFDLGNIAIKGMGTAD
jgi:AcrR family transcriptional regulator